MKLRDQLLDALKTLPGTRRFHLHVLLSAPHKHAELFPYASIRPRIYAQDMLILCSEEVPNTKVDSNKSGTDSVPEPPPHVLVSAIEAGLFHIPATTSAILYIAKVDSTGQGTKPAPTAALVRALIAHYAHPVTRPPKLRGTTLWVHLFARAERQYLFPDSADHPEKKPLNDVKLCAWWKRLLGRVVQELGREAEKVKMYYVLPGMSELEALQALGEMHKENDAKGFKWVYGHPYSQAEVALPYAPSTQGKDGFNLGQLIPSFDDDPKSRFIDEIACTTQADGVRSPQRKRRRTDTENKDVNGKPEKEKGKEKGARIQGELGVVSADEFWERMSFRQECVAGAVTGFFVLSFPSQVESETTSSAKDVVVVNPLEPQPGEVSHHLVQRVVHSLMTGHEFSTTERSLKATSVIEASIRGLCSGLHVPDTLREKPRFLGADEEDINGKDKTTEERQARESPPRFLEPPKTPPRRPIPLDGPIDDISPNPFPEPEPSADNYSSFVYGEIAVSNPDAPRPNAIAENGKSNPGAVTVLAVRKKKRT